MGRGREGHEHLFELVTLLIHNGLTTTLLRVGEPVYNGVDAVPRITRMG